MTAGIVPLIQTPSLLIEIHQMDPLYGPLNTSADKCGPLKETMVSIWQSAAIVLLVLQTLTVFSSTSTILKMQNGS